MPPEGANSTGDGAEYAFAMEYHGPPITGDLPRAVPINVQSIPVASVVSQMPLPGKFSLPVVQPILAPDIARKFSKELKLGLEHGVPPASLIAFDRGSGEVRDAKQLGLGSETTVSPTSVIAFEETSTPSNGDFALSGELGSLSASDFPIGDKGSGEFSDVICSSVSHEHSNELLGGPGSSGTLGFSGSFDKPKDVLGSSGGHRVSNGYFDEALSPYEPEVVRAKREPGVKARKGACYRCFKGSRFTEKESKRGNLGKCSRMFKRLLNDLEVRQIMKAEKLCEVNQLPPQNVVVNGKPLCQEEVAILQSCPNPPKKLKPGHYWYDKVSGLWGKEGQKPSKIISAHLNVGGPIKVDASSGNTQVYINGREITKVELRMLQVYILTMPKLSSENLQKLLLIGYSGSGTSTIFKQAKILYKDAPFSEDERESIKLVIQSNVYGYLGILLEGRERFEDESLNEMRKHQSDDETGHSGNTDGNDGKTIFSVCPRLKAFSDWLLKVMVSGNLEVIFPAATREYAPLVEELWNNSAIQATYNRRSELELLPSVASYFLERAVDILSPDYKPSDVDILYAEGVTSSNGLACLDFSFPPAEPDIDIDTADLHDSMLRYVLKDYFLSFFLCCKQVLPKLKHADMIYSFTIVHGSCDGSGCIYQLIRVQARGFGENCKWLEMFEDVRLVIFCVALSDYDQYAIDGDGALANKMLLSKKFFEYICDWFNDFHPVISRSQRFNSNSNNINSNPSLGQLAFHYTAVKFKRLYSSLTDRKLYVAPAKGLEPKSVDEALKYAREILKWEEESSNFSLSEYSIYSTEASTSSH
ncbi:hypothetical protein C3L33_01183, partial [Rhododendron williamsianum]